MNYSLVDTEAVDTYSQFDVVTAAALIAGIDPTVVYPDVHGEFLVRRNWDCTCEKAKLIRTVTAGSAEPEYGTDESLIEFSTASSKFNRWINALYEAIESGELPATIVRKVNPQPPNFRNMPRYADEDAPDPRRTKAKRGDIVAWLTSKGITKGYFFPKRDAKVVDASLVLDPGHPCYSPKLAAALSAWLHVTQAARGRNGTPKAELAAWIKDNLEGFPKIASEDGDRENIAEKVAAIANWQGGGSKCNWDALSDDIQTHLRKR